MGTEVYSWRVAVNSNQSWNGSTSPQDVDIGVADLAVRDWLKQSAPDAAEED